MKIMSSKRSKEEPQKESPEKTTVASIYQYLLDAPELDFDQVPTGLRASLLARHEALQADIESYNEECLRQWREANNTTPPSEK